MVVRRAQRLVADRLAAHRRADSTKGSKGGSEATPKVAERHSGVRIDTGSGSGGSRHSGVDQGDIINALGFTGTHSLLELLCGLLSGLAHFIAWLRVCVCVCTSS